MRYPHGTTSGYNHDACRCPLCSAANRDYQAARKASGYIRPSARPTPTIASRERRASVPPPVRSYSPWHDAIIAAAANAL